MSLYLAPLQHVDNVGAMRLQHSLSTSEILAGQLQRMLYQLHGRLVASKLFVRALDPLLTSIVYCNYECCPVNPLVGL